MKFRKSTILAAILIMGCFLAACTGNGNSEPISPIGDNKVTEGKEETDMLISNTKGKEKYKLQLDGYGLESKKELYAEGEKVKVYFNLIATDTDYSFYAEPDDVKLNHDYDEKRGYVLTFKMPAHDVKISMGSRNSMVKWSE